MAKLVSSTEAQNRFATIIRWATENNDGVIVEVRGKPKAAVISFEAYEELLAFRLQEQKRKALAALDALRAEVRRQNPDLTPAEAYQLAGFSPQVIQETLASDEQLGALSA